MADGPGEGSELARAIQEATIGRPPVEAAALWSEAAAELRGRRGGEAPVPRAPAASGEAEAPVAVARRPARRAARVRAAPRTKLATRIALVVLGVSVITLVVAVTWRLVGSSSSPASRHASTSVPTSPRDPSPPSPPPRPIPPPAPSASPPMPGIDGPPAPPSTIASAALAPTDVAGAPPVRRPLDHGLLRIDSDDAVDVYLQGVRVGETGRWLEVPCGVRNARLARRGSPPPGHSFPMWMGTGRTVHVPCGAAHAVRWTWE